MKNPNTETPQELEQLAANLQKIDTIAELDQAIEEEGGITMSEAKFWVFSTEYQRRGIPMPQ